VSAPARFRDGVRRAFDGIAARIGGTVLLALVAAQALGALVFLVDFSTNDPPVHNVTALTQRVAAIVQLVEATPPERRPAVIHALDDPFLRVEWSRGDPEIRDAGDTSPTTFIRRRVRRAMGDNDRQVRVEIKVYGKSFGGSGPRPAEARGNAVGPPSPSEADQRGLERMRLAIRLGDGSWLTLTSGNPVKAQLRALLGLVWLAGIAAIVTVLSVWAARRLAAPIHDFATAAERLGVDPEAPALDPVGPRELRQAIHAFNGMQERLRRFVADRTQMLAAISHDLRTPLTRLRLRAELVDDLEMQRKMLSDLDEMEGMIRASLAFARDDAAKEAREAIDFADLLQSLCDDRVDAGHEADYSGPAHFRLVARPVAMRRALANLMDNAIAYGRRVRVALGATDDHAVIHIDDDGPGIPEAERERVFAPFFRLEGSRSRDTGGVGLGLSTARTIIRGHGGDIGLENRAEGGLRVTVTLPFGGGGVAVVAERSAESISHIM